MIGQLTIYDVLGEQDPNKPIKMPEYDRKILKGIKGLSEILDQVPKYLVTFKKPVFGGYTKKVCIYFGWWHSLDGWNYNDKDILSWKKIDFKKGDKYRFE